MAGFNFSDTTPAPPAGKQNVKWQRDDNDPFNVSAYLDASEGGGAVSSVNGETGDVVLTAEDVDAIPNNAPVANITTLNSTTVNATDINLSGDIGADNVSISGDFTSSTSHTGTAMVSGTATINTLDVSGPATVNGTATFTAPFSETGGAINAKVDNNQAAIDIWNNTPSGATPAGGSHWRIFADNVGGGGGIATFGYYDVANGRVAMGLDNDGNIVANYGIKSPRWNLTQPVFLVGGLPISTSFTTHGGTVLLIVSGSCFSTTANLIGVTVTVDGISRGDVKCYSNELSSHKTLPTGQFLITGLSAGSHTLSLSTLPGSGTDGNDIFTVTVMEFPF